MEVSASIDIGQNLTTLLEKLSAQVGTTADEIFPWYVQQQIIEGYLWMGVSLSVFFLGVVLIMATKKKADFDNGNLSAVFLCIGVVLGIFGFTLAVLGAKGAISQILNPNYWALKSMTSDMARLIGK